MFVTSDSFHSIMAKNLKSNVWQYFQKEEDPKKVKWLLCEKIYSYCGGTTNLREHFSSQHSLTYRVKQVQQSSSKSQLSLDKYAKPVFCSESKSKSITDAIVDMVAKDV